MIIEKILKMLEECNTSTPLFPPTELYNEGWMLRIFLDWFSRHKVSSHPLSFIKGAKWYSEAQLPSAFLPRKGVRGDKLAESRTHADGVIGHFEIRTGTKADLALSNNAKQFIVTEAKMFSKLSSGVKNADYFDQASRNVACIVELARLAELPKNNPPKLGFYVLAPQERIDERIFEKQMARDSIGAKVKQRVEEYKGEKDEWFDSWFKTVFPSIEISIISWEQLCEQVKEVDPDYANEITQFYELCLKNNRPENE